MPDTVCFPIDAGCKNCHFGGRTEDRFKDTGYVKVVKCKHPSVDLFEIESTFYTTHFCKHWKVKKPEMMNITEGKLEVECFMLGITITICLRRLKKKRLSLNLCVAFTTQ